MKTIEEIKNEYARELGYNDFADMACYLGDSYGHTEITTRYAASRTELMVKDILELREQISEYLDDQKFQRELSRDAEEYSIYTSTINKLSALLEKTKHYNI